MLKLCFYGQGKHSFQQHGVSTEDHVEICKITHFLAWMDATVQILERQMIGSSESGWSQIKQEIISSSGGYGCCKDYLKEICKNVLFLFTFSDAHD